MTSDAYDIVARAYADTFPDLRAEEPEEIALIDQFAELAGVDALALDAGCGAGRVSSHLRGRGLRVIGVDLSSGMLAMALRDQPWLPTAVATGGEASGGLPRLFTWSAVVVGAFRRRLARLRGYCVP